MDDAMWTKDVAAALSLENHFILQQRGAVETATSVDLEPTRGETKRAVSNIRAWRTYLPEACVAKLIDDGWQWST